MCNGNIKYNISKMLKSTTFLIASCVMTSATAFAPAHKQTAIQTQQNTRLSCATTDQMRTLSEKSEALPFLPRPQHCKGYVGDVGFDPFLLSEKFSMEYLREAELKHGRVCMLAWTGWVAVDGGLRVYPVPEGWADLNSLSAHDALVTVDASNPQGFWGSAMANMLYGIAILELYAFKSTNDMLVDGKSEDRVAGDWGWDGMGFLEGKSKKEADRMKLRELKHARLGMFAFGGVVVQSAVVGAESFPYFSS